MSAIPIVAERFKIYEREREEKNEMGKAKIKEKLFMLDNSLVVVGG